jgi:hypothetical protein
MNVSSNLLWTCCLAEKWDLSCIPNSKLGFLTVRRNPVKKAIQCILFFYVVMLYEHTWSKQPSVEFDDNDLFSKKFSLRLYDSVYYWFFNSSIFDGLIEWYLYKWEVVILFVSICKYFFFSPRFELQTFKTASMYATYPATLGPLWIWIIYFLTAGVQVAIQTVLHYSLDHCK